MSFRVAITLAQLDAKIDAAWDAINVGELSYAVPGGRTVQFHTLESFQQHIDWLQVQYNRLSEQASIDAGDGGAPVVAYGEPN